MIALYYDNVIFHRSTSPATTFQLGGKIFQFIFIELKTRDGGHSFTFSSLNLPLDPNDAINFYIRLRSGFFLFAGAAGTTQIKLDGGTGEIGGGSDVFIDGGSTSLGGTEVDYA